MDFLLVHNADTKKVIGVIVQDKNQVSWVVKGEAEAPLEVLLTRGRIIVEHKTDKRTIIRRVVSKSDLDYLDMLRYKLNPPVIASVIGVINSVNSNDAISRLWKKFGEGEVPQVHQSAA